MDRWKIPTRDVVAAVPRLALSTNCFHSTAFHKDLWSWGEDGELVVSGRAQDPQRLAGPSCKAQQRTASWYVIHAGKGRAHDTARGSVVFI